MATSPPDQGPSRPGIVLDADLRIDLAGHTLSPAAFKPPPYDFTKPIPTPHSLQRSGIREVYERARWALRLDISPGTVRI